MSARDPTRWREQRSLDPELRALLDGGRRYAPNPEQLVRLAQRVEAEAHASEDNRARRPRLSATGVWYALGALTLMAAGGLWLPPAFGPEHDGAAGVATASVRPAAHGGGGALARAESAPSLARTARGATRTSQPPGAPPAKREPIAFEASAPAPDEQPRPRAIGVSITLARDEPVTARASESEVALRSALVPAAHRANITRRVAAVPRPSSGSSARFPSSIPVVPRSSSGSSARFPSSGVPARAAEPRPSELALLGQAQALLTSDASAALARLGEHAHLYPHGAFAEEREALAIDALQRMGRRAQLRERGRAFLANYPRSAQRERILEWLR